VGTTILLKMHGPKFMWITCAPLAWLAIVTFAAAWQKVFSPVPAIGFVAQAGRLQASPAAATTATQTLIFNARLDAALCGILLLMVATILLDSFRVWYGILRGMHAARIAEAPFVISRLRAGELYQRHFAAHGREQSGAEWRRFSEERMRAKYARASGAEELPWVCQSWLQPPFRRLLPSAHSSTTLRQSQAAETNEPFFGHSTFNL
jgi:hypothetical protein